MHVGTCERGGSGGEVIIEVASDAGPCRAEPPLLDSTRDGGRQPVEKLRGEAAGEEGGGGGGGQEAPRRVIC